MEQNNKNTCNFNRCNCNTKVSRKNVIKPQDDIKSNCKDTNTNICNFLKLQPAPDWTKQATKSQCNKAPEKVQVKVDQVTKPNCGEIKHNTSKPQFNQRCSQIIQTKDSIAKVLTSHNDAKKMSCGDTSICEFLKKQPTPEWTKQETKDPSKQNLQVKVETKSLPNNGERRNDPNCSILKLNHRCSKITQNKESSAKILSPCAVTKKINRKEISICEYLKTQPTPEWIKQLTSSPALKVPINERIHEDTLLKPNCNNQKNQPRQQQICDFLRSQPTPEWTKSTKQNRENKTTGDSCGKVVKPLAHVTNTICKATSEKEHVQVDLVTKPNCKEKNNQSISKSQKICDFDQLQPVPECIQSIDQNEKSNVLENHCDQRTSEDVSRSTCKLCNIDKCNKDVSSVKTAKNSSCQTNDDHTQQTEFKYSIKGSCDETVNTSIDPCGQYRNDVGKSEKTIEKACDVCYPCAPKPCVVQIEKKKDSPADLIQSIKDCLRGINQPTSASQPCSCGCHSESI